MNENLYQEALNCLNELEHNTQRLKACNCDLYQINILREEIISFQKGNYITKKIYPGEYYFLDSFITKSEDDKKLKQLFNRIYQESRK